MHVAQASGCNDCQWWEWWGQVRWSSGGRRHSANPWRRGDAAERLPRCGGCAIGLGESYELLRVNGGWGGEAEWPAVCAVG